MILHINSEYATTPLYINLVKKVDNYNIEQTIFASIKNIKLVECNYFEGKNTKFIYSNILKKYHRVCYFLKLRFLLKDVENKINLKNVRLIHAHKLFSDGGVAFYLKKKYNIPYIVAVRNTDINCFIRYMVHLRPFGALILEQAEKIILISPSYRKLLYGNYSTYFNKWEYKIEIIPNGIDPYWINNISSVPKRLNKPIKLLFVGQFTKNKNVLNVIKLMDHLDHNDFHLRIVGDGKLRDKIHKLSKKYKQRIELYPWLKKENLITHYKESDIFIMPSYRETFGLAYIEAMSQGLPVVYTKGQGIDGYFAPGEVGYAVDPDNKKEIIDAINSIIDNYNTISRNCIEFARQFDWENISKRYAQIYINTIHNHDHWLS